MSLETVRGMATHAGRFGGPLKSCDRRAGRLVPQCPAGAGGAVPAVQCRAALGFLLAPRPGCGGRSSAGMIVVYLAGRNKAAGGGQAEAAVGVRAPARIKAERSGWRRAGGGG